MFAFNSSTEPLQSLVTHEYRYLLLFHSVVRTEFCWVFHESCLGPYTLSQVCFVCLLLHIGCQWHWSWAIIFKLLEGHIVVEALTPGNVLKVYRLYVAIICYESSRYDYGWFIDAVAERMVGATSNITIYEKLILIDVNITTSPWLWIEAF